MHIKSFYEKKQTKIFAAHFLDSRSFFYSYLNCLDCKWLVMAVGRFGASILHICHRARLLFIPKKTMVKKVPDLQKPFFGWPF